MPQLVKGGKYVFGWSMVRINRDIVIPYKDYLEYGFVNDKKAILMSGSKKSGGFGLSSKRLLSNTPIGILLMKYPDLINYKITTFKSLSLLLFQSIIFTCKVNTVNPKKRSSYA